MVETACAFAKKITGKHRIDCNDERGRIIDPAALSGGMNGVVFECVDYRDDERGAMAFASPLEGQS